jgi:hypothetical protein
MCDAQKPPRPPDAFKTENRKWQDPLPSSQKKYAFNPLQDKPFIEIAENVMIAPWTQAILMKALPPSIYHLALTPGSGHLTRENVHHGKITSGVHS